MLPSDARLAVAGRILPRGRTFCDLPQGAAFWYENSNGLAEISVNQGSASRELGLAVGTAIEIVSEDGGHHDENTNRQIREETFGSASVESTSIP